MARGLYEVPGVARPASEADVKKAYRKLARQYHPDRNQGDKQAEQRFKEMSQANDVLSDPEKRKQYDQGTGPFAAGQGGGFGGSGDFAFDTGGMSDILSNLFGGGSGSGRSRARSRPERGRDLETEVSISF